MSDYFDFSDVLNTHNIKEKSVIDDSKSISDFSKINNSNLKNKSSVKVFKLKNLNDFSININNENQEEHFFNCKSFYNLDYFEYKKVSNSENKFNNQNKENECKLLNFSDSNLTYIYNLNFINYKKPQILNKLDISLKINNLTKELVLDKFIVNIIISNLKRFLMNTFIDTDILSSIYNLSNKKNLIKKILKKDVLLKENELSGFLIIKICDKSVNIKK